MKERLFIAPYSLVAKTPVGAAARNERRGTLLRFEVGGAFGYASLHPWPELGDADLDTELAALASGKPLVAGARALALARADLELARAGTEPFATMEWPESHYLVSSTKLDTVDFSALRARGFSTLKLKVDAASLGNLLDFAYERGAELSGMRLRLDANARLSPEAFEQFLTARPESLSAHLDFVEDPTPYDHARWLDWNERFGIRLALDRAPANVKCARDTRHDLGPTPFLISVVKPTIEDEAPIRASAADNMRRLVYTHNLDHPVGRAAALWSLGAAYAEDPLLFDAAGFCGDEVFATNAYFEAWSLTGPALAAPGPGAHWGFADLLGRESWQELLTP